jgi:hypothetical protein
MHLEDSGAMYLRACTFGQRTTNFNTAGRVCDGLEARRAGLPGGSQ